MSEQETRRPPRHVLKKQRNAQPRTPGKWRALQRNLRISPQKARLAVDLIRGKKVSDAVNILGFSTTRASDLVLKVLNSAVANASTVGGVDPMDLVVTNATVDKAFTIKRWMARGRGRVGKIEKQNSHVTVMVGKAK